MPADGRARIGNLPGEVSSFVDRGRELRELRQALGRARLVTLTGVGGTGKTRLALRVAAEVRRAFSDGVWFVDLGDLRGRDDLDSLVYAVMSVLGVHQLDGRSALPRLINHLAGRRTLLVLDNCEHLLRGCAALVDRLLRGCSTLKILATSRERLALSGETLFGVPPLPVPDLDQGASLAALAQSAAVSLLLSRAQAAEPRFALTEDNRHAVAALCRRLDGLPLAIELAATWLRTLTPRQIVERLAERFTLLSGGSRAGPGRQQTLQASVEWSYQLCSDRERLMWARLSVFAGGYELDAVLGVCTDEALSATEALDVLAGLRDKSIIERDDPPDRPRDQARYRMLETLRDYGAQRLIAAGELTTVQRRHRDWYEKMAVRASAEWITSRQTYWLDRLDREFPNIRTAVESSLAEPGSAADALRLLVALPPQWRSSRGLFGEELRWLEQALSEVTEPVVLRTRALLLTAYLAGRGGDRGNTTRRLAEGVRLARRQHDPTALAFASFIGGGAALLDNDVPTAVAQLEEGLAVLPAVPEPQFAPAVRLQLLTTLGAAYGLAGDQDRARRCYREILETTEPAGEAVNQFAARWGLGLIAWLRDDLDEAADHLRRGLRLDSVHGWNARYAAFAVEILAWVLARQRRHRLAAVLLGAAHTLRTEFDKPISSAQWMAADHDACEQRTREALGDAAFDKAVAYGRSLSSDEVVASALDEPRPPARSGQRPATGPAPLTRREREIAELVAQGLSNKEIASGLVISQRTVESHIEHILTKLGFTSRTQVAAWTATHPLEP